MYIELLIYLFSVIPAANTIRVLIFYGNITKYATS